MAIIECVPNISEGRQADVVARCVEACRVARRHGARPLLRRRPTTGRSSRSSVTRRASDRPCSASSTRPSPSIDLRVPPGRAPADGRGRRGALHPDRRRRHGRVRGARARGRRRGGRALRRPGLPLRGRRDLARTAQPRGHPARRVRGPRGRRWRRPEWAPDFGPAAPHASAGASVVGARMPLIAYNINLATDRLDVAKKIAAGHPLQQRRATASSRRWGSSSTTATSCRCR